MVLKLPLSRFSISNKSLNCFTVTFSCSVDNNNYNLIITILAYSDFKSILRIFSRHLKPPIVQIFFSLRDFQNIKIGRKICIAPSSDRRARVLFLSSPCFQLKQISQIFERILNKIHEL